MVGLCSKVLLPVDLEGLDSLGSESTLDLVVSFSLILEIYCIYYPGWSLVPASSYLILISGVVEINFFLGGL